MRTSFESIDLWDTVENGFVEPKSENYPTDAQQEELKKNRIRNVNALSMLHRAVSDSIFPTIIRAKKAQEAWKILQLEFLAI